MRSLKIFWVLLVSFSLIAFIGGSSPLMASSGPSHATHFFSDKGPRLPLNENGCYACHADGRLQCQGAPIFADSTIVEGEVVVPQFLATTTVCNPCHSEGGAVDGVGDLDLGNPDSVAFGAKLNWRLGGVYNEAGDTLKMGKQDWCAGCHDDVPSNSKADGTGTYAPNVMGDDDTYGYNASGHGRSGINEKCGGVVGDEATGCHDLTAEHIRHDGRTYQASTGNYMAGYRLNADMSVPRYPPDIEEDAFRLCFNCHDFADVFAITGGDQSNFRDDAEGDYYHDYHLLEPITGAPYWDSDVDGTVDSLASCPACHNVHGSPVDLDPDPEIDDYYPNKVMLRHGELVGHPSGFDFRWYDAACWDSGKQRTSSFEDSVCGEMLVSNDLEYNGVCGSIADCHLGTAGYSRSLGGTGSIRINYLRINEKMTNHFPPMHPNEVVRYGVNFTITGPPGTSYLVEAVRLRSYAVGDNWKKHLPFEEHYLPGTHEIAWFKQIPLDATAPDTAEMKMKLKLYDDAGLAMLDKCSDSRYFEIEPY